MGALEYFPVFKSLASLRRDRHQPVFIPLFTTGMPVQMPFSYISCVISMFPVNLGNCNSLISKRFIIKEDPVCNP